jgi:hypothetical protein
LQKTNIHNSRWYKVAIKNPIKWMDSAKEDLKRSTVNNSKNKSAKRMEWRSDVAAVKVRTKL